MAKAPALNVDDLRSRDWDLIKGAWLADIPPYRIDTSLPDPSTEDLFEQLKTPFPPLKGRYPDFPGVRAASLWEATALFHKCCHVKTAAERLSASGMQTWSCFNAYHSAYLGAKGIMALLGITMPKIEQKQALLDVFPEPSGSRSGKVLRVYSFTDMLLIPVANQFDHQQVWECFQKVLRNSRVRIWDRDLKLEVSNLTPKEIPRGRNDLLYRVASWIVADMVDDVQFSDASYLISDELGPEQAGFFLNLCFSIYQLFEILFFDLGTLSEPVRLEVMRVRHMRTPSVQELIPYNRFVQLQV